MMLPSVTASKSPEQVFWVSIGKFGLTRWAKSNRAHVYRSGQVQTGGRAPRYEMVANIDLSSASPEDWPPCGPSKPLSHARMVLRCFNNKILLANLPAKPQTPMVMVDQTKLSPAICAMVFKLGHETVRARNLEGTKGPGAAFSRVAGMRILSGQCLSQSPPENVVNCRSCGLLVGSNYLLFRVSGVGCVAIFS
jgi:hypothetical protein